MTSASPPDTLTIALAKVDFLAPDRVTDDTSILTLKNLVLEPLCRWHDGLAGPALFARWTCSQDGRRWRFVLRDDATFHDGTHCTVAHVVAFVDRLMHAVDTFGMPWPYARYLAGVAFDVESATVLSVASPRPLGDLVDLFCEFYPSRPDTDGRATIGTGPYRVVAFEPGLAATLERIGDLPAARTLRFVACADPHDRSRRVRDGACDGALDVAHAADEGLHWQRAVNTLSVIDYLNCGAGLFRSRAARMAINRAVDVPLLIDELFGGLAVPAATVVSPFHLGYRDSGVAPIAHDADDARRLFDLANASEAIAPLLLRTPRSMPNRAADITACVASMLTDVGLDVRVEVEADRPEYARQVGAKRIGDVAIFDSSPHSTYRILNDKISSGVRGTWWQGYDNPDVERAIAEANAASGDTSRAAAYGRCLALLRADPPWLFLFHPIELVVSRNGTPGLALDHRGILALAAST